MFGEYRLVVQRRQHFMYLGTMCLGQEEIGTRTQGFVADMDDRDFMLPAKVKDFFAVLQSSGAVDQWVGTAFEVIILNID